MKDYHEEDDYEPQEISSKVNEKNTIMSFE